MSQLDLGPVKMNTMFVLLHRLDCLKKKQKLKLYCKPHVKEFMHHNTSELENKDAEEGAGEIGFISLMEPYSSDHCLLKYQIC